MLRQLEFDWSRYESVCADSQDDSIRATWISQERGFGLFLLNMIKTSRQVLVRWSNLVDRGDTSRLQLNERAELLESAAAALAWICDDSVANVASFRSVCELHDQDHIAVREAILSAMTPGSLKLLAEYLLADCS